MTTAMAPAIDVIHRTVPTRPAVPSSVSITSFLHLMQRREHVEELRCSLAPSYALNILHKDQFFHISDITLETKYIGIVVYDRSNVIHNRE